MEVIDIGLDDLGENTFGSGSGSNNGVNFGGGIELLMNDKKRTSSNSSTKIDLQELDNLENELNALSGIGGGSSSGGNSFSTNSANESKKISGLGGFSNFFNLGGNNTSKPEIPLDKSDSNIGQATAESVNNNSRTWDGFSKIASDIPFLGSKSSTTGTGGPSSSSTNMTDRERRRKKRMMIKKLEEWYEKGTIKNTSRFTMDSNYEEIEDEYEGALEDKRKKDSIKLQGWWFTTFVNTIEYGNAFINPFDLNLDGWGEQVSEDLDSYEEIFAELHEKYKGGKMAPELSLLLRLGFSAAVVNMSNKMLSSAAPGFGDVMKQSPELMRMFTSAAVDTMSKQSPTFEFAKNMMNPPEQVSTKYGPPPASVETKNMGNMANRAQTPFTNGVGGVEGPPAGKGMQFTQNPTNSSSRPDLAAARPPTSNMFREQGVDIQNNYQSAASNAAMIPPMQRPEMRGPQMTDIDNLLSGLKTKPVSNIQPQEMFGNDNGGDSMISITSLKDLEGGNMPKRTNRKPRQNKSDKNTFSLDI
jgi:hypothetical protein